MKTLNHKPNIKTPIAYYGGKTAIIGHILKLIPEHTNYTETFFGGGTVFFAKDPVKCETINDRLDIVVNFYIQLKSNHTKLKQLIDLSVFSRTMHRGALNVLKGNVPADDITRAWAFWFCSNFSYSNKIGGGIKQSNDQGTMPPQTLQNKKAAFTKHLVKRIENAFIENNEAITVLRAKDTKNTFHYIDPPYPNADQGHYHGYDWYDYEELLKWCSTECKGKFLLSNYNSDMLDKYIIESSWSKKEITHRIKAPRKSGAAKVEVLVSNYPQT